jgi:hypothetical protein
MKTLLLLLALSLSVYTDAQTAAESDSTTTWKTYTSSNTGLFLGEDVIPYVVGSYNIPGYELETRVCSNDESVTLSNGRRIAGLSCILFDTPDYIGGEMVFGGDTTVVTNIVCAPVADGALFTVTGEEFNMSFTLTTGIILKYESNYAIFNTEGRGVWTIHKKV